MGVSVQAEQISQRTANLAGLLRALRRGPRSRSQLAAHSGLYKATVSSLVTELADRGLVRPAGLRNGGHGRPSQLVELRGEAAYGLALRVEADGFSAMSMDLAGVPLASRASVADVAQLGLERGMDELAALAEAVCADLDGPPIGVAVSVPGLVDTDSQVLRFAPALRWRDAGLADLIAARLGVDLAGVVIENEANLGAFAEVLEGPGVRELFYLSGGIGVGGGLVSGGVVLRGSRGFAGEIGHITIDAVGDACSCGRTGCLETKAGFPALLRAAASPPDPLHDPALGVDARVTALRDRIRGGDQRAAAAVHDLGTALSTALATVVDLVDPEVLVLGGYFAGLAEWLVEPIRVALGSRSTGPGTRCRVVASTLGTSAALLGAAHLATERLFADPTLAPLTGDGFCGQKQVRQVGPGQVDAEKSEVS
ncbi:ROK family transcriptional regulator [Amycolatopsis sp. YIM 10]|uniref:ROK family transcriptional regulator n=1 Tax=Amycolatopsis sp. YIM 10 TaxID=2653857 RepID=UPI00129085B1|nr:ROK family transcriptional regulator [Amycolatopsis sp. YIM 10]QFU94006.1 N-acetylglucosamine repressor [Amycolatopsis sp. YIM 10]